MNMTETEMEQRRIEYHRRQMAKMARRKARKERWGAHLDTSRMILALALIAVGFICLLNNLGITSITFSYAFGLLWPSLLIALGVMLVVNFRSMLVMVGGLLLMVTGALFLVHNTGLWRIDFRFAWGILWPLIVVFIGANLLFHQRERDAGSSILEAAPEVIPPAPPSARNTESDQLVAQDTKDSPDTPESEESQFIKLDKE